MTEEEKTEQETGEDIQPNQEAEVPEGHTVDDPDAEKYPGAPRPGMIPNQAPEGQPPAVSVTPSGEASPEAEAQAADSSTGEEPSSA